MINEHIAGRAWQQAALARLEELRAQGRDSALVVACPGGGKTRVAIAYAKHLMDAGVIDYIVVIAPSDNLRSQWTKELESPEMAGFTADAAKVPLEAEEIQTKLQTRQARAYTFQSINAYAKELGKITAMKKVIVIVDEVHHAGEQLPWGDNLRKALQPAKFKLVLSGTPWRSDGRGMPFVNYDQDNNALPDYAYTRADALAAGKVVREATFIPVNTYIEAQGMVETLHPVTKNVVQTKTWAVEGKLSDWKYVKDEEDEKDAAKAELIKSALGLTQEGSYQGLVDPARIESYILDRRENRNLAAETVEELVLSSNVQGIHSDPKVCTRLMWESGQRYSKFFAMHKATMESRRKYAAAIDTKVSQAAMTLLEQAHEKLMTLRSPEYKYQDATAGGLVVCENKAAARSAAELVEKLTGKKPRLVLSDVEKANDQIAEFRKSDEEWIVTVKMVSEGVDIKRLRVIAYLSNVMSELFIAQVLGRITRWRDDISQEEQTAYFFIMAYPPLMDMCRLVDGRVMTRPTETLVLPPLPPLPIQCSPVPKQGFSAKELHKNCTHVNASGVSRCEVCGWPLRMMVGREREMDASENEREGSLWRGHYAEEKFVQLSEDMIEDDPFLDGLSPEMLAVVSKHVHNKVLQEIWKKKTGG